MEKKIFRHSINYYHGSRKPPKCHGTPHRSKSRSEVCELISLPSWLFLVSDTRRECWFYHLRWFRFHDIQIHNSLYIQTRSRLQSRHSFPVHPRVDVSLTVSIPFYKHISVPSILRSRHPLVHNQLHLYILSKHLTSMLFYLSLVTYSPLSFYSREKLLDVCL